MKNKKNSTAICLLLAMVFALAMSQCKFDTELPQNGKDISRNSSGEDGEYEEPEYDLDEKQYWQGSIEEDFDGSTVLVVLDRETGGINKEHDIEFFGGIEIEYIKDLMFIEGDIHEALIVAENFRQILLLKLPGEDNKNNVINVIRQLEQIDGILYAGPDYALYPDTNNPDDPRFRNGSQWSLNGTNGINAPAAWEITVGDQHLKVGIIDSGVSSHPDLNANLIGGRNFVGIDNDDTTDNYNHGVRVAGILGAVGNNNTGLTGVCQKISLVPLKITNKVAPILSFESRVISAIGYAAGNNIRILNLSYGSPFILAVLKNAISNYDGLFVCSAGNNNRDNDGALSFYPANYNDLSNLISVGASNKDGGRYSTSNWGNTKVDLFAPGDGEGSNRIPTTGPNNTYDTIGQTSGAAPHVAGVAALMLSVNSSLTPAQIKSKIKSTVTPDSRLTDLCVSGGRLNAYWAVLSCLTTVTRKDIPGVTPPVVGAFPVTEITQNDQYSGTVSWLPAVAPGGTFAPGTPYIASITLKAKVPYKMQGVPLNFFTVAGSTTRFNAPNSGNVTAVFPATAATVNLLAIPGVPAPVIGGTPATEVTTDQYTGTVLSWSPPIPSGGTFNNNTSYTAIIFLTPKEGYTFTGVQANSFSIAGSPSASVSNAANSGHVTAVFPAADYFNGGTGDLYSPCGIADRNDFNNIRMAPDKYFVLMDDISLADYGEAWTPIDMFSGNLNGDGYTVSFYGIDDSASSEYAGMFRENYGTIKNMIVSGNLTVARANAYYGIIAGSNRGNIINCETELYSFYQGDYMIINIYSNSYAGGIAGRNFYDGVIEGCINSGNIYSTGGKDGIAAVKEGAVNNCNSSGALEPWDVFAGGSGTEQYPYLIGTGIHFKSIALAPQSSNNIYYKLLNNIEITVGTEHWEPIDAFYGHLDGDGHEVQFYRIEETAYGSYALAKLN